jgi:hypothetical protein
VDEDFDGARDSGEPGVADVLVTAFGPDDVVLGSTRTGLGGAWILTVFAGQPARIEFTELPAGLLPGQGADTVRFTQAPDCDVDLPLVRPPQFCQAVPDLATTCFTFGPSQISGGLDTVVSFPDTAGAEGNVALTEYDRPGHTTLATSTEVGSVWGLAWQSASESLFTSAFVKRHSGLGPGGPGAIYRVDRALATVETFVDLNGLFGSAVAGTDPHAPLDYFHDSSAWDAVGKSSLGGLDLSEDGQTLWVMNLADRKLYGLPIGNPPRAPSASQVGRHAVPLDQIDCPAPATDIRPFAVATRGSEVFVGLICTAESTGRTSDLRGYVYAFSTGGSTFRRVLSFPLNHPRGCADRAWRPGCDGRLAAWRPWSPSPVFTQPYEVHPQPWLTDLAWDGDVLLLGLRDRFGDQRGDQAGSTNPSDSARYSGITAGDLLRACPDGGGGWTLESNGACGGVASAGAGNGQGPGGGEFYFEEDHAKFGDPAFIPRHHEVALGGLAQVPGRNEVAVTAFDPIPIETQQTLGDGGVIWLNHQTGARGRSFRVYDQNFGATTPLFGKSNGLGDLEALCDPAPLDLGNRIWNDLDRDGIQDAGEPGVPGVTVDLYSDTTRLGVARTNSAGEYYFNGANVTGGLRSDRTYSVRVRMAGGPLQNASLTLRDRGANDLVDSDGALVNGVPEASVTTGGPGESDHSVDFGFTGPILSPSIVGDFGADRWRSAALCLAAALLVRALILRRRRPGAVPVRSRRCR